MKSSIFTRLTTGQLFVGLAGGLALYLTPKEADNFLHFPAKECYIAGLAMVIALVLLVFFRSYETVGLAMMTGMLFIVVSYVSRVARSAFDQWKAGEAFALNFPPQDGFIWAVLWLMPFIVCMVPRVFAVGIWDTPEKREDFMQHFRWARNSFLLLYSVLLFCCFIFNRSVDFWGERTVNLLPFHQIANHFSSASEAVYFLSGNLLFFLPIGFFLSILKPKWRWWSHLLMAVGIGLAIELSQLIFNTGMVDIDDILLNAVGYLLGCGVKHLIDRIRCWITQGEEKNIAYQ